jgi:hypothetical protein
MSKTLEYVSDRRSPVGDVGIELEVEGKMLTDRSGNATGYFSQFPHIRNWVAKQDGSLRNGIEYVTRTPVKVDDKLEKRISSLVDSIKNNVTDDSYRTSCHVHVNCLRLTPRELVTGLTSYWLAEEILADYWGEERKGNHYALRLKDGLSLTAVNNLLSNKNFFNLGGRDYGVLSRYAACNITAFLKHGSVEFRGMRGTVDTKVIHDWVKTAHYIMHTASKRYKSPVHLFENYMNTSNVADFMKKITGPYISDSLDFSTKKLDIVNDNAIKLAGLAYLHEDGDAWEEWENELIKERSKRTEERETAAANSTATPTSNSLDAAILGQNTPNWSSIHSIGVAAGLYGVTIDPDEF